LKKKEKIEQLRCLELDIKVQTLEIDGEMLSVDTHADLKKISAIPSHVFTLGTLH
jgi:CMP-2-keto-3-deoxyoctulosonic acid synthetase